MKTETVRDGDESFNVSIHDAARMTHIVLFAVGAGGQPQRHATLLSTLVESGCMVVAPHFKRLASPIPSEEELTLRARRLSLALDAFVPFGAAVTGVGHSIGAATLIALAGAQMWLGPGRRVDITPDNRLVRLALLAPPTGFFQAPGALDDIQIPILAWSGTADNITPPAQIEWLARTVQNQKMVDMRVTSGAGHFSFMDQPPPHTTEPLANKQTFLKEHSQEVCKFVVA